MGRTLIQTPKHEYKPFACFLCIFRKGVLRFSLDLKKMEITLMRALEYEPKLLTF